MTTPNPKHDTILEGLRAMNAVTRRSQEIEHYRTNLTRLYWIRAGGYDNRGWETTIGIRGIHDQPANA